MSETPPKPPNKPQLLTYVAVAVVSGLLGFGAVYAIQRPDDNSKRAQAPTASPPSPVVQAATAKATPPTAAALNPLSVGDMQTFVFKKTPEPIPEFKFEDGNGAVKTLADWKGKVVLLNLWATWCAPCRKEMPDLDRLQKELGGPDFEVVALSLDREGAPVARKFLESTKVETLKLYIESTSKSIGVLRAAGLPTTILIDREGREIGRLFGPAEWNSADAKRLIQSALK